MIYACFRSNQYKSDFTPTAEDRKCGRVVLHPLRDDHSEHLQFDVATGLLEPLTETGRFHIALLRLNRPELVSYRLARRHRELLVARHELMEAEIRELRSILQVQDIYITRLKRLLNETIDDG